MTKDEELRAYALAVLPAIWQGSFKYNDGSVNWKQTAEHAWHMAQVMIETKPSNEPD